MIILGIDLAMRALFFILMAIFTIYTLFLGYHWYTYSSHPKVATLALTTYLIGGAILFLIMAAVLI